jgi:hypothetical protein
MFDEHLDGAFHQWRRIPSLFRIKARATWITVTKNSVASAAAIKFKFRLGQSDGYN